MFLAVMAGVSFTAVSQNYSFIYEGKTYVYDKSSLKKETAEELKTAKAVYALQISEEGFTNVNSGFETHKNKKCDEYAIECFYRTKDGGAVRKYIIFTSNGYTVETTLPEDFEPTYDLCWSGYGEKAGFTTADLNGVQNSVIFYIR